MSACRPVPTGCCTVDDLHELVREGRRFGEALGLLRTWGFAYKSMFVWCKPQMGLGHYWRVSHEFLLLGVKGNCPFLEHDMKSWEIFDRDRHSSKPEQVRLAVERVSPGPRLELFARDRAEGWTAWGNQIERTLFNRESKAS